MLSETTESKRRPVRKRKTRSRLVGAGDADRLCRPWIGLSRRCLVLAICDLAGPPGAGHILGAATSRKQRRRRHGARPDRLSACSLSPSGAPSRRFTTWMRAVPTPRGSRRASAMIISGLVSLGIAGAALLLLSRRYSAGAGSASWGCGRRRAARRFRSGRIADRPCRCHGDGLAGRALDRRPRRAGDHRERPLPVHQRRERKPTGAI